LPTFVVQEHWATAHHFDFRLEMDGVLKSWAVPKGPSLEPGIRRLAVAVDDHPLDYGSFEGSIPKSDYGAGKVVIWDKGEYTLIEHGPRLLRFELHGNKLKGEYALIYFKEERGKAQWLLLKKTDTTASKRKLEGNQ
jgi:bifunctional non-homologous end joining protein LigD